jgi:hypothetical protein
MGILWELGHDILKMMCDNGADFVNVYRYAVPPEK